MSNEDDERIGREWYEHKSRLMEEILGAEHDVVMHSIIPYCVGGGLDLYYFLKGIPGTGIATKELCESPETGSSNDVFDLYELVMFTQHAIDLDSATDESTEFGRVHSKINAILNCIARYSATACLNPNETCEFPSDMERIGGKCLIFDGYGMHQLPDGRSFGLLAILEIYRSEMDFARKRKNGGRQLIDRLIAAGHYPYSDLDRKPVV